MEALRKVLVVDDDPVVGKSFDRVLGGKGYAVITASNAAEALAKLAREDYDVVYTDIKMPGMDGLEMAGRLKEKRPWLPVVIVTGYGSEANEAAAKEIGVSGFLRKPLSPETIESSAVAALLAPIPALAPIEMPVPIPAPAPVPLAELVAPARTRSAVRQLALLAAAPFIGLGFVVAFPFVGLALLGRAAIRALLERGSRVARFVRNVGLFFAAQFIGLAYAIALPFVGLGMLAWHGYRAIVRRGDDRK